jgi:hypothetical protein
MIFGKKAFAELLTAFYQQLFITLLKTRLLPGSSVGCLRLLGHVHY